MGMSEGAQSIKREAVPGRCTRVLRSTSYLTGRIIRSTNHTKGRRRTGRHDDEM